MNTYKALDNVLSSMNEAEKKTCLENQFGYIFAKAASFLKQGPAKYSQNDAFGLPPSDTSPEILEVLQSGCKQIIEAKGFSIDKPLQDLGVFGFYRLMEMFHFDFTSKESQYQFEPGLEKGVLDTITFTHKITGDKATLYNFCSMSQTEI